MSQILVATHSTLAEGFAQAVKFFKADADNVHYLNGYVQSQEFEKAASFRAEGAKGISQETCQNRCFEPLYGFLQIGSFCCQKRDDTP